MNSSTRPVRLLMTRSVLATTVLGLVVSGLAAVAHAHPTAPAAGPAPELVVGTYNIRAGVSLPGFKDAITAFKSSGVEVAGLQEIGSNDRNKYLLADHTWGYYRPPALQQNPIIWDRDRFDVLGAGGYMIAEKRDLHGEHSGDEAKGDSWATVVRLLDRETGLTASFLNVHLVRGAIKGGRPVADKPHLVDLYYDQVAGLVAAIEEEGKRDDTDQVFVLGDFNVGYEADAKWRLRKLPYKRFTNAGLTSMWKNSPMLDKPYGTHRDALIDQVWTTTGSSNEQILRHIEQSDHWPALATYTLSDTGYVAPTGSIEFHPDDVTLGAKERDGGIRQCDLTFRVIGDLTHGYADLKISGTAAKGEQLRQGDYNIDVSQVYDTDLSSPAKICVDFQGDTNNEDDETIVLTLTDPSGTVLSGASQAVGTIQDDD